MMVNDDDGNQEGHPIKRKCLYVNVANTSQTAWDTLLQAMQQMTTPRQQFPGTSNDVVNLPWDSHIQMDNGVRKPHKERRPKQSQCMWLGSQ